MEKKTEFNRNDFIFVLLSISVSVASAMAISNLDKDLGLYILVGLFGIAISLAMFIKPSLGANILIIAIFSSISKVLTTNGYPGIIKPLVVMVAVVIAARYVYIERMPSVNSKTSRIELFLFLLFVFTAASLFVASDKDRATASIIDLGKDIVVIYCIVFALRSIAAWKSSIWAVILTTFVLSLLGLYQTISGNYDQIFFGFAMITDQKVFSDSVVSRLGGPINAPNIWGQTVVAVIALVLFRVFHARRLSFRFFAVVILGVLLFEVLNTYSRGAYLALTVIVVLFFFVLEYRVNPVITLSGIVIIIVAFYFLPAKYTERFQSLLVFTSADESVVYEDGSLRGRSSEMLTGLSMFASSPFLGVGAGNYNNNYQEFTQKIGIEVRAEERDAHSFYIELLAETGILGFLAFVSLIVVLFNNLAKAKKSIEYMSEMRQSWLPWLSSIQVSLVGYLVGATFLHDAYIRYFWVLVGLAIAAIRLTDEIVNENKNQVVVS